MESKHEGISFSKFFKKIDFFSITFQFRVANKEKYSSFFGGVSSLFYIVITLAYLLKSFFDFISWSDKKIQFITKFDSRDLMNITNRNFFYSFKFTYLEGFQDQNLPNQKEEEKNVFGSKYWDLFDLENNYVVINLKNKTKTKQAIRNCSHVDITNFQDLKEDPENQEDDEKPLDISEHICFDYPNISLYGQYTDNKIAYVEIMLKIKKKYYLDLPKLKNILENVLFKFAFYYSDYIYDVSKLVKPVTKRVESTIYSYLDYHYYERVNIFLQNLQYSFDDYPLYKKPKVDDYIRFSSYEKSISPMLNRLTPISTFSEKYNYIKYFIRPDMKKTIINVTLMKIPEFLSAVSAISTNLLIIFGIIVSFLNRFQAKQKIVTKIMKFNDVLKINNRDEINYLNNKMKDYNCSIDKLYTNHKKNNLYLNNFNKSYLNETRMLNEEKSKIENEEILFKNKHSNISLNKNEFSDRSLEKLNDHSKKRKISNDDSINLNNCNIENNNYKKITNSNEINKGKNMIGDTINVDLKSLQNKKKDDMKMFAQNLNPNIIDVKNINILPKTINLNDSLKDIQNFNKIEDNKYSKTHNSLTKGRKLSNPLKITTCELISNYVCCRNIKEKKKIFNIAEEKFNNNIDVLTYQRKMLEIDILKYLILDKDLLEIMNFISKPTVSYKKNNRNDDEMTEFFLTEQYKRNNLCMFRIKDSYDRIVDSEDDSNSYVKERILKLFRNHIEELA